MRTGRVFMYIGAVGLVLIVLAVLAVAAYLWSLPTGPVPAEDPIARLNREHADLTDNAADLYEHAFAKLNGDERKAWGGLDARMRSQSVPETVVSWLDNNREAMALAAQAAERDHCWFKLTRDSEGTLLTPHLHRLREVARLFYVRAAVAAREHDAQGLADAILTMNGIGRHAEQCSGMVANMIAVACLALTHEFVLDPFGWPELTTEGRAAYAVRMGPYFRPLAPFAACLAVERDELVWMVASSSWPQPAVGRLATPERVAGELDQTLARYHALLNLAVHEQSDPQNAIRRQIASDQNAEPRPWEFTRSVVSMLWTDYLRPIDLRHRVFAMQCGDRTVMELFLYRDRAGEFPTTLDPLASEFTIDPYTGAPFVYRRTDTGFTLYSRGLDRDDDGGTHDGRFGERRRERILDPDPPPDGDFVFWPIQEPQPNPTNSDP